MRSLEKVSQLELAIDFGCVNYLDAMYAVKSTLSWIIRNDKCLKYSYTWLELCSDDLKYTDVTWFNDLRTMIDDFKSLAGKT